MFSAGTEVRFKHDPGKTGVLTGKNRERAGTTNYQVVFSGEKTFVPEYELEIISDNEDWYDLLDQGRFGRVGDLRRNLSYIQLSGRLANLVYSMDATNTEFYAYQFKPVLSLIESPSNGLLIADEVGLGKTIEAGLIWTELRARYESRRLLVLCPAMLREKWRSELKMRFGVDAEIMGAKKLLEELKQNKHQVPDGKGIICSLQGVRPPRNWQEEENLSHGAALARFLEDQAETDPLVDLLIVDEAHYLRNPESQTAKLGGLLNGISHYTVLLSATPINLRSEDLFHLLKLVDPDSFYNESVFPQVLEANEPLQKARSLVLDQNSNKSEIIKLLESARSHDLLAESRQLEELIQSDLSQEGLGDNASRIHLANRIEKINLLSRAVSRTRKSEVTEWRVIRDPKTQFIDLNEIEKEFYDAVTQEVSRFSVNSDVSAGFLLASPQRQISSSMYAAAKAWKDRKPVDEEFVYEDLGLETGAQPISPLVNDLATNVTPRFDLKALWDNDSKYDWFYGVLNEYFEKHADEKIVVFSYFRGTLNYLSQRLEQDGIRNHVLMGGMQGSKQDRIDSFRDDTSIRVLLSSEVASEGVDLQFCRVLINYDLPWNPMKVEQRIGRIDRLGQNADKISIRNLCYADTIDHRIHERLFLRLGIFEKALGGMEAILGEKIKDLSTDLLSGELNVEEQNQRIEQTALAIEKIRHDSNELENQASSLIAHGGYILEQVQAAHDFKKSISEQDIYVYVKDYLDQFCQGHVLNQAPSNDMLFEIRLPPQLTVELGEFIRKHKLTDKTKLAMGELTRCQFTNKIYVSNRQIEPISQFHPLVRYISADLRKRGAAYFQLVAAKLPQRYACGLKPGQYAYAVNRWSFSGLREEEEIRTRVISLEDNKMLDMDASWELVNMARVEGGDWLASSSEVDLDDLGVKIEDCASQLVIDYEHASKTRDNENKDRVSFQTQSLKRHKERQLNMHHTVLEGLKLKGHTKLIPAREGLINKVHDRFNLRVEELKNKSKLSHSAAEVCVGIILVE